MKHQRVPSRAGSGSDHVHAYADAPAGIVRYLHLPRRDTSLCGAARPALRRAVIVIGAAIIAAGLVVAFVVTARWLGSIPLDGQPRPVDVTNEVASTTEPPTSPG
ncbi:MAG: hypothetical protein ACHQDC_03755 [Acidimicrobiales bacterium]